MAPPGPAGVVGRVSRGVGILHARLPGLEREGESSIEHEGLKILNQNTFVSFNHLHRHVSLHFYSCPRLTKYLSLDNPSPSTFIAHLATKTIFYLVHLSEQ